MWVKYLKKLTIFERSILRGLNKKIGIAHFLFLNRKYKNSIYFLTLNIKEKEKDSRHNTSTKRITSQSTGIQHAYLNRYRSNY